MTSSGYEVLEGSEHVHPPEHTELSATAPGELITVTLIVRRRARVRPAGATEPLSRADFAATLGADPRDLTAVEGFARRHGLQVLETDSARRSVVVRGTARALDGAFAVRLHDYRSPAGKYRGHAGAASVPAGLAAVVEAIVGLDSRTVPARHFSTLPLENPAAPAATTRLTAGRGRRQTIGIYAMHAGGTSAGYTAADLADRMRAFGGLPAPQPVDVSVHGVVNSGVSDGATGLDITVAAAMAPEATIAVYFTGGQTQSIIRALQRMIHPGAGDPQPTVVSISYGWDPDDATRPSFSEQEYEQIEQLFEDAAVLGITVLLSAAISGSFAARTAQRPGVKVAVGARS